MPFLKLNGFVLFLLLYLTSCDKLPDYGIVYEIPDYYLNNGYLDDRVNTINNAIKNCSDSCEVFFWITDMHWEPDLNTRHSPALIRYIALKTGISKILNGGDTGNSSIICSNAIDRLRDAVGSDKVYSVNGNHEINDASRYEKPFNRVCHNLRGHNNDIIYGDQNRSYFYFDNSTNKIRYIGLSAYGVFLNNDYKSAYTKEQLNWLNTIALKVEYGWTIVVFTHSLYNVSATTDQLATGPVGSKEFINAIDNYQGEGKIACVLMGHSHRDRIHIGSTGIPYIISACDRYAPYKSDLNVERVIGTISEQHFEVVLIDKRNNNVYLYSIGANARDGYDNDSGIEVDLRTVAY
ncbi:ser/Thr phosphatase family protein [Bacteroides intestinalis CAG:315]|nr:ser/Thr phosphatase family protein [Bacteroides intestinalis CAG:315]